MGNVISVPYHRAGQSSRTEADEAILRIRRFADLQVQGMEQLVTDQVRRASLHAIAACVDQRLNELTALVHSGKTFPLRRIRLAESSPPAPASGIRLRIGVYPLAANPLHWGHLLVGLTTLTSVKLDKVIFVVAGRDPRKPSMPSPEVRHRLAQSIIQIFEPFLEYSPMSLGTDLDGETNLGRLFSLNPGLPIHAFYIAGSDHYRRRDERGEPDTIEKLERVAREGHSVSAVFIDRPDQRAKKARVDTFLDVQVLPPMPFVCSSTAARRTLCRDEPSEAIACLPYATLAEIRSLKLYSCE